MQLSTTFRYWSLQLIGWGLFIALSLYQNQLVPDLVDENMKYVDIIVSLLCLLITHIGRVFFFKNNWRTLKIEKLILHGIFIITMQAAFATFMYGIILKLFHEKMFLKMYYKVYPNYFFTYIMLFTIWAIAYVVIKFVQRNRNNVIEKLQMENSMRNLEIKTIKNNLQPHFVFNALNSIRALIDEDPNRARQSVTQLSNLLRSSIQADKNETVPFAKEVELVKDYLSLESIRYEERLRVTYHINENTLPLPIPPMMLQTLVENAIKHGIAALEKGGDIIVSSSLERTIHIITILNSGQLDLLSKRQEDSNGFGLESTKQRLQLLFGDKASLSIKNQDSTHVLVTIKIPQQTIQQI